MDWASRLPRHGDRGVAHALTGHAVTLRWAGSWQPLAVRTLLTDTPSVPSTRPTTSRSPNCRQDAPPAAADPDGVWCLRAEREPHYRAVATVTVSTGPGPR